MRSIIMDLFTALHISYIVNAAIDAPVRASISTPVLPSHITTDSILILLVSESENRYYIELVFRSDFDSVKFNELYRYEVIPSSES